MDRLFTPVLAAKRLRHGRGTLRSERPRGGRAWALRRFSAHETSNTLAPVQPLESLHDLGIQPDHIAASLIPLPGGSVEDKMQVTRGAFQDASDEAESGVDA
jgi:hypothetical protein